MSLKKKKEESRKRKSAVLGSMFGIGFFLLFGIVTAITPNSWFTRMIPANQLDWIFLILSSLLIGAYIGVDFYKKKTVRTCNVVATSGSVGSFLAFACPICNKLLVALFGATVLLTYFEPYRPILGIVSNTLLGVVLYWRIKA